MITCGMLLSLCLITTKPSPSTLKSVLAKPDGSSAILHQNLEEGRALKRHIPLKFLESINVIKPVASDISIDSPHMSVESFYASRGSQITPTVTKNYNNHQDYIFKKLIANIVQNIYFRYPT